MRELTNPTPPPSPRITPPPSPRNTPPPSPPPSPRNTPPPREAEEGEIRTNGVIFLNNIRSKVTYDRVLRTPISVNEIINWGEARKKFVHKRFCENIIRVVKRLAPRSKHGFNVIQSVLNKMTPLKLFEKGVFDSYKPVILLSKQSPLAEDEIMFPQISRFVRGQNLSPAVLYYKKTFYL